jgi:hypothetical protein
VCMGTNGLSAAVARVFADFLLCRRSRVAVCFRSSRMVVTRVHSDTVFKFWVPERFLQRIRTELPGVLGFRLMTSILIL